MPISRPIVDKGLIHIIDLIFIKKDAKGVISSYELNKVDKDIVKLLSPAAKMSRI